MARERTIGAAAPRRYDLPLSKGEGTRFLVLLIALMTFLGVMALAAVFTLSAMTARWSSGLANNATVEIPAGESNEKIVSFLQAHPAVKSVDVMSDEEVLDLVRPWMGDAAALADFPLPGLIGVELREDSAGSVDALNLGMKDILPSARLDTHQAWLRDVLRFTGGLKFAALALTLVIGLITATAVGGAVKSRMAIHREEVEILHLMGASDSYIGRQFQRHSGLLALRGGIAGTAAAGLCLGAMALIAGKMDVALVPGFHLGPVHIIILALVPLLAAIIAVMTTGRTVKQALEKMP